MRFMTGAALACALTVTAGSMTAAQEKTVMVGGAPMSRSKDIIDNAVNSKDHTTLQSNGVIHVISSVAMPK